MELGIKILLEFIIKAKPVASRIGGEGEGGGRGKWTLTPKTPTRNRIQGPLANLAEAASVLPRDIPEWTCPCVTAQ